MAPADPKTLAELFRVAMLHRKSDALLTRESGTYKPISSREFERRVIKLHHALKKLGLEKGNHCAVLSENRWEWSAADFAMLTSGIVSVPVYPTLPAKQVQEIVHHADARVVMCSNRLQVDKIRAMLYHLPQVETVISFNEVGGDDIVPLSSLIGSAEVTTDERRQFDAAVDDIRPENWATVIYTSGTTGEPKGVVLSHGNVSTNVRDSQLIVDQRDLSLAFLPLSHIAQRLVDFICFKCGTTVAHVESIEAVQICMQEVRPTAVAAVPRFFEKIHARIISGVEAAPAWRKRVFHWCVRIGRSAAERRLKGAPLPFGLKVRHWLANRLVFSKLKQKMGGRIRIWTSGAAALGTELAEFFYIFGLPIYEGYGLTETSPLVSICTPEAIRFGSVGKLLPHVEGRIASDGEILVRGPNVLQCYYKKDDLTKEAMAGGWFHTGDVGRIDEDGYLWITDRKKDLIKTSSGKYVAPAPIETLLCSSPLIQMAVVVGERRHFPAALIVPDFDAVKAWCARMGFPYSNDKQMCSDSHLQERLMAEVVLLCRNLPRFEKIKKIALVSEPFSIERGELTPTLKVRRRQVHEVYRPTIDAMYE